ncbi:MAG: hypothetical protein HKN73_14980, partial [Gemmatimonadetes bacterium]|nr:hypothetical protein [Gemmatimonadota bacterium]
MRLSLILFFAVLPRATPLVAQPAPSNELEQLARDILEEMVGINTAHSEGSTLELARA